MERSDEYKRKRTEEITEFFMKGYIRARLEIPDKEVFDLMMAEVSETILEMQSKCGVKISMATAAMLLMLPNDDGLRNEESDMFVKAALVWYVHEKVPDMAKELGFDVEDKKR